MRDHEWKCDVTYSKPEGWSVYGQPDGYALESCKRCGCHRWYSSSHQDDILIVPWRTPRDVAFFDCDYEVVMQVLDE